MLPKHQLLLWIAHPVLQLCVGAVMVWRKQYQTFPVFFAYLVSQVLIFSILFPIYTWGNPAAHFYPYLACTVISLAIGYKVIYEIFLDVFRSYPTLKDLGSVLFKWAALVMLLVAVLVAVVSPGTEEDLLAQAVMTVQRCVRVTQCGLIMFLLLFSRYLAISWRRRSFGIALGFGSFATAELIVTALSVSGRIRGVHTNLANMVAYNCAILIWFVYALVESPAQAAVPHALLSQRWEQSLSDLRRPASNDSLIPMFEGMVERALSRNADSATEERAAGAQGCRSKSPAEDISPSLASHYLASKI